MKKYNIKKAFKEKGYSISGYSYSKGLSKKDTYSLYNLSSGKVSGKQGGRSQELLKQLKKDNILN